MDESGASLVEYALLLALIAVVAIGALIFLGHGVNNTLQNVANNLANP
ncbi:MAG TPA: Flp family type IVb pilin [Acidimicrobiales bacterium]|nr:Flp family type IVb pilin [Acidimicrobiales bacterium]